MKRIFSTSMILSLAVGAFAFGTMMKVVQDTYRLSQGSSAMSAKCMLCHTRRLGGRLNAYGLDLKAAMHGSKVLTPAILHKVESKDSSGTGMSNGAKLKAGMNPGAK